jgi:RNA polymerase sigma-70 factor (ECF subfamily)
MDRSADMALPDATRVRTGVKSASYRSGRFGKPGTAKPTGGQDAAGATGTGPLASAPGEESPRAAAVAEAGAAAVSETVAATRAAADKPDLSVAVEAAQGGDEQAFRVLYRDMQPRLLRYLRAMVGEDAEDVASEAWLHIARDLPGFSGDSDGFRGWASTIARHRAMDHQRRHRRRPQQSGTPIEDLGDLAGNDDTAASALDTVSTEAAIAMISELPRDQAEAVLLRVVMGLDAESAGKVLGKRSGAVRTATYRGLRRLASRLEQAAPADDNGESRRPAPLKAGAAPGAGPPGREKSEE